MTSRGDELPVSAFPATARSRPAPPSGRSATSRSRFPCGTRRSASSAASAPWSARMRRSASRCYDPKHLQGAPATFKSTDARDKEWAGLKYTIQVAPEDCTGCGTVRGRLPGQEQDGNPAEGHQHGAAAAAAPARARELGVLPHDARTGPAQDQGGQHPAAASACEPLFEFSGACSGCGETPYVKLLSQLFGDRALIANATGCSSIYGGNLPTTPWTKNAEGRGPAWSNSLFEDNAEFGLGFRLSIDKQTEFARELLKRVAGSIGEELVDGTAQGRAERRSRHLRAAPARGRPQGEAARP